MNKQEFDHVIRAASSVVGIDEVLVIGSQAAHASIADELPPEALRSIEVDVAVFGDDDGSLADLIDGSIGEASMFHESFGFYAQGVSESTAVLPDGWRDRLVRYESSGTSGAVAWCLELHDLWISKAIAGRPKDVEFCQAFRDGELVDPVLLVDRLQTVPDLSEQVRARVTKLAERS